MTLRLSDEQGFGRVSVIQHIDHLITCAHGVVVDFAGRTFFIAVFLIVCTQNAPPRTMLMIDQVPPRVSPQSSVNIPVCGLCCALRQECGGCDAFRLRPERIIAIADLVF